MSPDEIRLFLSQSYPELVGRPRRNPDGWSFFLGEPQHGIRANRILRACRRNHRAATRLMLPISSRYHAQRIEIDFQGDEAALRKLVEEELQLFRGHFAQG